jgi:hypothetical protein
MIEREEDKREELIGSSANSSAVIGFSHSVYYDEGLAYSEIQSVSQ